MIKIHEVYIDTCRGVVVPSVKQHEHDGTFHSFLTDVCEMSEDELRVDDEEENGITETFKDGDLTCCFSNEDGILVYSIIS